MGTFLTSFDTTCSHSFAQRLPADGCYVPAAAYSVNAARSVQLPIARKRLERFEGSPLELDMRSVLAKISAK
jgi:hypothetical protein